MMMTYKPATAVIEGREQRRHESEEEWLVAPPLSRDEMSRARMDEPVPSAGRTQRQPNEQLRIMLQWLEDIYEQGGTAEDLWKAWGSWSSPFPAHMAKGATRDVLDRLVKRANVREADLRAKADLEALPERAAGWRASELSRARAALAMAEAEKKAAAVYEGDPHARVAGAEAEQRAARCRQEIARIEGQ